MIENRSKFAKIGLNIAEFAGEVGGANRSRRRKPKPAARIEVGARARRMRVGSRRPARASARPARAAIALVTVSERRRGAARGAAAEKAVKWGAERGGVPRA